jgi:hypothetical protein
MKTLLAIPLLVSLSGCLVAKVADTAVDVATLPVKVAAAGVDAATTSQSEADQNRGRAIRKEEERRGRELRKMEGRCRAGRALATDDCTQFERR